MVNELIYCFELAGESDTVRVIILEGAEGTFWRVQTYLAWQSPCQQGRMRS